MEYLAVAQMRGRWARTPLGVVLGRSKRRPRAWHAVSRSASEPMTLCGYRYSRELHRTWSQTLATGRCRRCERLIDEAEAVSLARGPLWASPWIPDGTDALSGGVIAVNGVARTNGAAQTNGVTRTNGAAQTNGVAHTNGAAHTNGVVPPTGPIGTRHDSATL